MFSKRKQSSGLGKPSYTIIWKKLLRQKNLSEIRNHHLDKAPEQLQAVEDDYYTAYNVDYTESLVGDFGTEQRNYR